jgi:hypothetical protein
MFIVITFIVAAIVVVFAAEICRLASVIGIA